MASKIQSKFTFSCPQIVIFFVDGALKKHAVNSAKWCFWDSNINGLQNSPILDITIVEIMEAISLANLTEKVQCCHFL